MSRPLSILALVAFAVAGLLPLAAMAPRVGLEDLVGLFDARSASLLGRTVLLGGATAFLALAFGLPFGFLVARTDVPGARLLRTIGVLPLLLPPLFIAMTWDRISDVRGAPAAICVLAFSTFPLVAVFSARAAERIDARREDAARLAGGLGAVLRMELPLVLPAALAGVCLAFTFAVNDFAVPDYVSSVGPKFNVYADEIFSRWSQTSKPGGPVAAALPLVLLSLAALVPALRLRRRGALATIAGDFRAPERIALGPWRWPAWAALVALLVVSCGVPLARMLWEASGGPRWWGLEGAALGERLAHMGTELRGAFGLALERSRGDLGNSLLYSAAAATVCVPLGLVLGHAVERARGGRWLELFALLPIAAPAVLFGIGEIAAWNHAPTARFYGSGWMVVLLMAGRFAPFALLIGSGATASVDPSLEDAGALAGARPATRLARIVAPLLAPALAGAWVLVFLLSMRELDAAILVPAANHTAIFRCFNGVHFGRDPFVFALCLLLVASILLPGLLWGAFARRRLEIVP